MLPILLHTTRFAVALLEIHCDAGGERLRVWQGNRLAIALDLRSDVRSTAQVLRSRDQKAHAAIEKKGKTMTRIRTAMILVSALSLMCLSGASSQTSRTGTLTPQSQRQREQGTDGQPKSVPGSVNRGNGAVVKAGYIFVRRGDEVDVVRQKGLKTGTYVCSCRSGDANKKCELLFSPKQILCRQGSCSGASCLLVTVEPASAQ